jgi:hypothetical protein
MRTVILAFFALCTVKSLSQFTLEHVYDNASTMNYCGNVSQLLFVKLESSGERFIKINRCQKLLSVYDINHQLLKNVSLAAVPLGFNNNLTGDFIYISEHLFNLDNKMEFMFTSTDTQTTVVYNEDNAVLFSEPGLPLVRINLLQQQYPIYNTSTGTKLIISYANGDAKVFALSGTLTVSMVKENSVEWTSESLVVSPNPSSDKARLEYQLPEDLTDGEIILFDSQSVEKKRFHVDGTFNSVILDHSELTPGVYFYQLYSLGKKIGTRKSIVIR